MHSSARTGTITPNCALQRAFDELRAELEPHLLREEEVLFPACVTLEQQGRALDEAQIAGYERDHASIRDALAALRVLTDDYESEGALCGTHRMLLDALAGFELDLHRHIDEENGLLIRVGMGRERGGVRRGSRRRETCHRDGDAGDRGALPRCCRAWIAEQARTWDAHRVSA